MEKPKKATPLPVDHLTPEEREKLERMRAEIRRKMREARKNGKDPEEGLTPEEREQRARDLEERRKKREERDKRITILRGISLRIPLMIYGAKLDDENTGITIDNFTQLVDPASWEEFMPRGVTKAMFNKFKKCYNPTVFTAAGKRIRTLAREADTMHINDRIDRLNWIFSTFHNPDKETVLTPWKVVNRHMSDTLGGYSFFNERFDGPNQIIVEGSGDELFDFIDTTEPRFVNKGNITKRVFGTIDEGNGIASRVLEINSKTGLYPLYVAYTMYRKLLEYYDKEGLLDNPIDNLSTDEEQAIWDDVVSKNIYVICNTLMAARITRRTLMGFREPEKRLKIKHDQLIERARSDSESLINSIKTAGYWNGTTNKTMIEFDAIVGNPPYQVMDNGGSSSATPIYNIFVNIAKKIKPHVISMITPSRWFAGGKRGLDAYRNEMMKDKHISHLFNFTNGKDCFPSSSTGSVNYFLWNNDYNGDCEFHTLHKGKEDTLLRPLDEFEIVVGNNKAISILHKVIDKSSRFFQDSVKPYKPFGLRSYARGEKTKFENSLKLYSSEGIGYIAEDEVTACKDIIPEYKIMTSKLLAEHAGEPDKTGRYRVLSKTLVIEPYSICTESYLILASFPSEEHVKNCFSYCCTKFFRFLLLQCMSSINMTPEVFRFVPMEDFGEEWTDEKLYEKYQLTKDEIAFIESMIKPMD